MQSGISAAVYSEVFIWKAVQNSASLSTGRAKIIAKKKFFSTSFCQNLHPKLISIFYQDHQTLFKLSSAFFELCYSLCTFRFFFPTATSVFTTPLKQHSAEALLCRADKSLKNPGLSFAGSWSGGGETCLMPLTAVLNESCL